MKVQFIQLVILSCFSLLLSCKSTTDRDMYEFLAICHDEFFLDLGVNASERLKEFEGLLIEEGHLIDASGKSYVILLRQLAKKTYFDPPLIKEDFNNALLYKNPKNLYECIQTTYGIDSLSLSKLNYYRISESVADYLSSSEEVLVQGIFRIYADELSAEEFELPYINESTLLLFYRWYFSSKYDRSIPIELEEN